MHHLSIKHSRPENQTRGDALNYLSPTARLAIYADGYFASGRAKTAEGVMRYGQNPIAAVIDSQTVGQTIKQVVGIDCDAPIVSSLQESLQYKPNALLLGTAPTGGQLPDGWRKDIILAMKNGMDVVNGLHEFLTEDEELVAIAKEHNVRLLDVRKTPDDLPVGSGKARFIKAHTVLTVGSDVSIGKMTVTLEIAKVAKKKGFKAKFIATGQTGIMITGGEGIAIDRVIGDFMAGATEQMVVAAGDDHDFVLVEGQGSLAHPGFSGVTLGLLHGACPKALIFCHQPSRTVVGRFADCPMPELERLIALNETMAAVLRPAKVVGIALNTRDMDEEQAKKAIAETQKKTNLPCTDPVRFGADILFDAILADKEKNS
jgi:uncharacterized NAD-dependent epimerase/dehydratase family protein